MTNGRGQAVTLGEAAEMLNLNVQTVRRLLKEGKLTGFPKTDKPRSHWLILVSSIDAYDIRRQEAGKATLEQQAHPAAAAPES